jgi:Sec-independent protein translocase protein TatA
MAELTNLESKLAEVLGLAGAAKGAVETVKGMLDDDEQDLAAELERMKDEASETERRCTEVAGQFDGKKTAIVEESRETKQEATEMMKIYLEGESDALDGFEFLTMAEAGEVGHWAILNKLNERAGIDSVTELTGWALPIQERHLSRVLSGSLELAGREDPNEPAD